MKTKEKMTEEEFHKQMKEISTNFDVESRHAQADELMLELLSSLGYEKGVREFRKMDKWYA